MKITLCGSTRFREAFELWNKRLTLAGHIAYSVSGFGHSGDSFSAEEKEHLDLIHLRKIMESDAIVVIDPGGYIGDSTRREIAWATLIERRIYFVSRDGNPNVEVLRHDSARPLAFDWSPQSNGSAPTGSLNE